MAFGYGGALLVVVAHGGIIRASTRLLRRVHSAAAGPAALPLSLFWTGALTNYSEPELLAFGSAFTQRTARVARVAHRCLGVASGAAARKRRTPAAQRGKCL